MRTASLKDAKPFPNDAMVAITHVATSDTLCFLAPGASTTSVSTGCWTDPLVQSRRRIPAGSEQAKRRRMSWSLAFE
jgi:hypothetical protein